MGTNLLAVGSRVMFVGFGTALVLAAAACSKDSNTATAPVAPAPSAVAASGGDHQVGIVGEVLQSPVIVQVTDAKGAPVAGVSVTWSVSSGGGSVSSTTTTSDENGHAEVLWTLGTTAGAESVQATVGTVNASFTATAAPGEVAALVVVAGDQQNVAEGTATAPLTVKAVDAYGNAVAGAIVSWVDQSGGTLATSTTTTDANGLAQDILVTDPASETYTIVADVADIAPVIFSVVSN